MRYLNSAIKIANNRTQSSMTKKSLKKESSKRRQSTLDWLNLSNIGRHWALAGVLLIGMLSGMFGGNAWATQGLSSPVAQYPIECNAIFSCPNSLLPRVGFWVEVFSRWDTNTAIFHDKNYPHRVYSTLTRNDGCRKSRKGDSVYRERKRLKNKLTTIAKHIQSGRALSRSQQALADLFDDHQNPQGKSAELRAAAKRIRCQSGNKNRMREALTQFQLYRPTILDALESQNLTLELQYLPFVESAFNPTALSHVGAAGLWQIMPQTGRALGLSVNNAVDERYDPTRATYAAALYFRNSVDDLTETAFEHGHRVTAKDLNPFVITSYNYGVRGMQRAIKQVGLNYERLLSEYKSPNFQTAVKNFYASFLAARFVAKNSQQFFGEIVPDKSQRIYSFNTVALKRSTSAKRLSRSLKVDVETLKRLNPALKQVVWRNKALAPKGFKLKVPYRATGWDAQLAAMYALPKEIEKPGFVWHRVRRGQTACGIARKYKASCRALVKLNRLNKKATIYTGQRLKVPSKSGGISVASTSKSSSTTSSSRGKWALSESSLGEYRVRRGDSACSIANKFKMHCNELLALNGLTRQSIIKTGQRLRVSSEQSWHLVKRGQTACAIAEQYRVPCAALLNANRLHKSSILQIGQRLRIPNRV